MTPYYCSKGHENPPGSRFCLHCGEKLEMRAESATQGIQPGQKLGDRYLIVRQLGQGGFGRTYIAEDTNRFNELCVLKEFSPQVQTAYVLQKAEELFQREANVLYKLQHPQIPHFRELLRLNIDGKGYLFLVQDYVDGQTYRSLLEQRKRQGLRFSEAETRQILQQILPVIEYIHSLGVIHRDISPDNLIQRSFDHLPVLIDFGGVKQVVATVASQYYQPGMPAPATPATLLGKIGYAPPEQMQTGRVEADSDLYALAATMLVLLTGKEPPELIDPRTLTWNWRREISLSPNMGVVLDKMLSQSPDYRYHSVREVMQALTPVSSPPSFPPTIAPPKPQPEEATFAVASPTPGPVSPTPPTPNPSQQFLTPTKLFLIALLIATAGGLGVWGANRWLDSRGNSNPDVVATPPTDTPKPDVEPSPPPQFSPEERDRKEALRSRRRQLGIDYNYYVQAVNQIFWHENPSQEGKTLSDSPEDAQLRTVWDKVADEFLDHVEAANISSGARRKLGSYSASDRNNFIFTVNDRNLSGRALYDLTDAKYLAGFSDYSARKLGLGFDNFLSKPLGQIWMAIASDRVAAIQAGTALQRVVFDQEATGKEVSGTLAPGQGIAYIAGLSQDQLMSVNLTASPKALFSVYPPTSKMPAFLEDTTTRAWSGTLPSKGFYEFVIVSTATAPINYQLNITAENPTPTEEPTPTETPTEEPTPTPEPTP